MPRGIRGLLCDSIVCSVLHALLAFFIVCTPPYPQFTAAKRSPCPVRVVYLSELNFPPIPLFFFVPMTLSILSLSAALGRRHNIIPSHLVLHPLDIPFLSL